MVSKHVNIAIILFFKVEAHPTGLFNEKALSIAIAVATMKVIEGIWKVEERNFQAITMLISDCV